jgi:hypothetical protein
VHLGGPCCLLECLPGFSWAAVFCFFEYYHFFERWASLERFSVELLTRGNGRSVLLTVTRSRPVESSILLTKGNGGIGKPLFENGPLIFFVGLAGRGQLRPQQFQFGSTVIVVVVVAVAVASLTITTSCLRILILTICSQTIIETSIKLQHRRRICQDSVCIFNTATSESARPKIDR